ARDLRRRAARQPGLLLPLRDPRPQRRLRRAPGDAGGPEPGAPHVARRWAPAGGSADAVEPGVAPERLGDGDGAVGPLVVLEQRRHDAGQREAAAVERMDELGPAAALGPEADVRPPRLEVLEVR